MGVGAAAVEPGRARAVVLALAVVAGLGRGAELADLDGRMVAEIGRLEDAEAQRALADALLELGAEAPAVLEYNWMSLLQAWTDGRVRPWLYGRSTVAGATVDRCRTSEDPAWLAAVLRGHVGGHVVVSWGPAQPDAPAAFSPEQVQAAAELAQVRAEPVRQVRDDQGRWLATIWGVERD